MSTAASITARPSKTNLLTPQQEREVAAQIRELTSEEVQVRALHLPNTVHLPYGRNEIAGVEAWMVDCCYDAPDAYSLTVRTDSGQANWAYVFSDAALSYSPFADSLTEQMLAALTDARTRGLVVQEIQVPGRLIALAGGSPTIDGVPLTRSAQNHVYTLITDEASAGDGAPIDFEFSEIGDDLHRLNYRPANPRDMNVSAWPCLACLGQGLVPNPMHHPEAALLGPEVECPRCRYLVYEQATTMAVDFGEAVEAVAARLVVEQRQQPVDAVRWASSTLLPTIGDPRTRRLVEQSINYESSASEGRYASWYESACLSVAETLLLKLRETQSPEALAHIAPVDEQGLGRLYPVAPASAVGEGS